MVRLLIADTDVTDVLFADEEIAAALDMGGSAKLAAATLLGALASNHARLAMRIQRGGVSEDMTQVAKELRAQAAVLREEGLAEDDAGAVLEATISPSYERYSYTRNLLLDREDEVR
ncbi:MAG: hypothetical protein QM323_00130 [Acidobacteriota bacterium]|nr:hypothetical protein [Acidobacteriota bacterium]